LTLELDKEDIVKEIANYYKLIEQFYLDKVEAFKQKYN